MQNKKWLVWAFAFIVVLVGASVAFNLAARTPEVGQMAGAPGMGSQTPAAPTPAAGGSPAGSAEPGQSTTGASNGTATSGVPKAAATGGSPSASSVGKPKLEVPATTEPSATTLPKSVEPAAALAGKIPREGTAKGKLTPGFPKQALPIPEGAHVVDSSVSTQKQNVQAAVNLRTNMRSEKVLAFYESHAAKMGWLATRGTEIDGAPNITMGYGKDTVVAAVRTAGTGATAVAIFGSFVAGK